MSGSETVAWFLAFVFFCAALHSYRRWQYWADEWLKEHDRQGLY